MARPRYSGLEHLFGSKTRVKLLRIFLINEDTAYFVRELTRTVDAQINSIRRELNNLEKLGMIVASDEPEDVNAQKKFYRLNKNFVLYRELRELILKAQLLIENNLIEEIKNFGTVKYLALTGFFVGQENASTDMLIVGSVDKKKLSKLINAFQKDMNREINYTVMATVEFNHRRRITDRFLYAVLESKKIVVIDETNL